MKRSLLAEAAVHQTIIATSLHIIEFKLSNRYISSISVNKMINIRLLSSN